MFYSPNVYSVPRRSKGCAEQNGGKRVSPRLRGFGAGRERPQGPESSLMLACRGTETPRKQGTFQKSHSY